MDGFGGRRPRQEPLHRPWPRSRGRRSRPVVIGTTAPAVFSWLASASPGLVTIGPSWDDERRRASVSRHGTGFGHRTRSGRGLSARRGCRCSPVAKRHAHPSSDRNRLCPRACARECGGVVAASREHLWCFPRAGRRQPGHDRCWALAPPLRQEIANGHRYARVLHDVVLRWFGRGRMRTTLRRGRSGRWSVGCPADNRNGVVHQRHRHLRESAVNP
jgi:hypothetical protein